MTTSTFSLSLAGVFGQNLLVARLALDWTQQTLAEQSGVSRATIAQLEAGTGDPKLSTVQQLAEAFGVSPLVLLLGKLELHAVSRIGEVSCIPSDIHAPTVSTMTHLANSGTLRSRLEVAHLGVALARQEGVQADSSGTTVGAAIGSFHLPGSGTLAGAHLATLIR